MLAKNTLGSKERSGNLESLMLDYGDLLRDAIKEDAEEAVTKTKLVELLGKKETRLSGLID